MSDMIAIIAGSSPCAYSRRMIALALRLLVLVSVALMPAGMASAAAAAQPAESQSSHCSGHEEQDEAPAGDMDAQCMACAGLPVGQVPATPEGYLPNAPRLIALTSNIHGIILEIATPPPKLV
jgi:hypothetical protein